MSDNAFGIVVHRFRILQVAIGDEAFPLRENLMKPYPPKSLDNPSRVL